jgi:hypothetical protein
MTAKFMVVVIEGNSRSLDVGYTCIQSCLLLSAVVVSGARSRQVFEHCTGIESEVVPDKDVLTFHICHPSCVCRVSSDVPT